MVRRIHFIFYFYVFVRNNDVCFKRKFIVFLSCSHVNANACTVQYTHLFVWDREEALMFKNDNLNYICHVCCRWFLLCMSRIFSINLI